MSERNRIYWSDREGNPPPDLCTFHFRPSLYLKHLERVSSLPLPIPPIKPIRKTYLPHQTAWISGVEKSLQAIRSKELGKVVLARACVLEYDQTPDPLRIASALKQKAQGAYVFCIQTEKFSFVGASPECLFIRNGREIASEAVAGTRKRGATPEEDDRLQQELLNSAKDRREHLFVQDYLQEVLDPFKHGPLCFSPLAVLKTQNVQHLYSRCTARLKENIADEEILDRLHPTPALCGLPKQKALSLIKELEPFSRGLYGGALGWRTEEAAEFIVGIRSCLIQGNTVTLFSGTGIVDGSDPSSEWNELNDKLKIYEGILL